MLPEHYVATTYNEGQDLRGGRGRGGLPGLRPGEAAALRPEALGIRAFSRSASCSAGFSAVCSRHLRGRLARAAASHLAPLASSDRLPRRLLQLRAALVLAGDRVAELL